MAGHDRLTVMHGSGRRAWVPALGVGLVLVVAGCGMESGTRAPASTTTSVSTERSDAVPGEASVPHALLESEGWMLEEAVDRPPDNILAGIEPVPSDWWAQYQRLESPADGVIVSRSVKLTGLAVGLDAYRAAMEPLGFTFRAVDTASGAGVTGTTAEQGAAPVIVAVPLGDGTLELLGYELSSDELVALVADVHTVDETAWRAAGGEVR
jgi:hypothetical protein